MSDQKPTTPTAAQVLTALAGSAGIALALGLASWSTSLAGYTNMRLAYGVLGLAWLVAVVSIHVAEPVLRVPPRARRRVTLSAALVLAVGFGALGYVQTPKAPPPPRPLAPGEIGVTTLGDLAKNEPATPAAVPPAPPHFGVYFIDVGSSSSEALADAALREKARGIPGLKPHTAWIWRAADTDRSYHQLFGMFLRREDAEALCEGVAAAGVKCAVTETCDNTDDCHMAKVANTKR